MATSMSRDIETTVKALKANRFDPVKFAETADAAVKLVLDMIPQDAAVGVAGSGSVRQIGLVSRLRERGTKVMDIVAPAELPQHEVMRQTLLSDILLTSSNAVTLDGKLVNIDGIGNRVAAMVFGPRKAILIIGTNKLVRDVHEGVERIKNTIAPYHARGGGRKTPCAVTLRCTDCKSPARICNVTTIIEKKPSSIDIAIVLVGEDLGLGWDPAWSEERKERIYSIYRETRRSYSQAAHETPAKAGKPSS